MSRYRNGQVPDHALVFLGAGVNADGHWEHLLPAGTVRKHRALVELGKQRRGRTLAITTGWNGYRPIAAQRVARANACARGRCGDAATVGTSSHGGEYQGRDVFAIDYSNWAWVWGTQAAFYAACREVGLEPGVFSWEPWHVIDRDPWAPAPATQPDLGGLLMALSDAQQVELFQDVKAIRSLIEPVFHALMDGRPEYYEGKYNALQILLSVGTQTFDHTLDIQKRVRGPKPNVDMLQDILGQLHATRQER